MELRTSAAQAAGLMRSLANEKRLMLLCHLVDGEKSVGELCDALGIAQTNASQQLALLRRDGVVRTRRDGQTIYYSVAGDEAPQVIRLLHGIFCRRAAHAGAARGTRRTIHPAK